MKAKIAPSVTPDVTLVQRIRSSDLHGPSKQDGQSPTWVTLPTTTSKQSPAMDDTTASLRNASGTRIISFKGVSEALSERSGTRRVHFWLKFLVCVVSVMWNIASPIKSYMLSFYGLPGDDLVFSHDVNWTMQVDYQYARELYDKSGAKYTAPANQPIRFINMYLDFVVFNRATIWAKHLDDFQQDPYVGLFCRASLVPSGDKIMTRQNSYCGVGGPPGFYAAHNYVEQQKCRVSEVSEAVMCLKGITVLVLLNYEWKSGVNASDPFIREGARLYQDLVFPNLDACLLRRQYLTAKHGRDEALHQLVQELAANYSLDPTGFGGKKGLYAEVRFYDGFKDLSGKPSGVRYSKMSGALPQRTQPIETDLNALVAGRERLWWISGETPQNFRDKVDSGPGMAYYGAYLFIGMHINNSATTGRFVERYSITATDKTGVCQNWALNPTAMKSYPDPVYLDVAPRSSVVTTYNNELFRERAIAENNVTDPVQQGLLRSRMSTICLARDGCTRLCTEKLNTDWLASFDRSGLCQRRVVSQSIINRQGYVDKRCLGEGIGTDILSIKITEPITRADGSTFEYHHIRRVANPGAVVACVLGGRIPQQDDEPFPNIFFDLLESGANTIITTTFSRGTEKVLVNIYTLVSLLGCTLFSVWVLQCFTRVVRVLNRARREGFTESQAGAQLLDSVFTVNFATVAHGRNLQLSKSILWVNLVTWYIGAADSNCTWWVDGVDLWTPGYTLSPSESPYYACKPGKFVDHLTSPIGLVRLFSISYNFYSLTAQHTIFRGATRYSKPFVASILLFGLLPTFFGSLAITGVNHLRLQWGLLLGIHNQLLLVVLWTIYLFAFHALVQNATLGWLYVQLICSCRMCGRQKVKPGSTAETLVGAYYLTLPQFVRSDEVEWIPLSVAMESEQFDMTRLELATRKYSFKRHVEGVDRKRTAGVPNWVLEEDEFFFC